MPPPPPLKPPTTVIPKMERNSYLDGKSFTDVEVTWNVLNFAHIYKNEKYLKKEKITFEVNNGKGTITKWEASLDFRKDHHETSNEKNTKFLALSVVPTSHSKGATSVMGFIFPKITGSNSSFIFTCSATYGEIDVGRPKRWFIKQLKKNADISRRLGEDGTITVSLLLLITDFLVTTTSISTNADDTEPIAKRTRSRKRKLAENTEQLT